MHKVIVVVPTDPVNAYDRKGTSEVVRRVFNPNNYFDEIIILSPFETKAFIWQGYKVIPAKSYKIFKSILKQINPMLVRVYGSYDSCTFAINSRLRNYPLIVSIHDDRESYIHKSIKYADHIIAVSDLLKEKLVCKGISGNKITVIGNRIDYNTFKPLEQNQNRDIKEFCERTILHIGKKTHQKNLDTLIESMVFLPNDVRLLAIGRGDVRKYQELANSLNLQNRIEFKQSIPNHKLNSYYNNCEVFCVPSRNEGFGVVFIEAAAAGAKIVTSNKKPMNEILSGEFKNVFLENQYTSPKHLAATIVSALRTKKDEIQNDIIRLRENHRQKFSFEAVSMKEIKVYESNSFERTSLKLFIESKVHTTIMKVKRKLKSKLSILFF